ncbi:hypothetical protein [Chroococcidiopsis sp.]|uniref:hypothetical protein n=1 Tax=Chroococcidiopsis sp. TaxID=3088168 RepID=UPI003F321B9B
MPKQERLTLIFDAQTFSAVSKIRQLKTEINDVENQLKGFAKSSANVGNTSFGGSQNRSNTIPFRRPTNNRQDNYTELSENLKADALKEQSRRADARIADIQISQIEKARSLAARITLAEQSLQARKDAGASPLAIARGEEQLKALQNRQQLQSLKYQESLTSAKNRSSLSRERMEIKEVERLENNATGWNRLYGILGENVPMVGKLSQGLGMFSNAGSELSSGMGALTSSAGMLAGAIGVGLIAAFALAGKASEEFSRQLDQASKRQQDNVLLTTSIQAVLPGVERKDARKLTDELKRELNLKSEGLVDVNQSGRISSAVLDDYLKVGAETGEARSVSVKRAADIGTSLAALSAARGKDPGELQNVLTDITAGTQSVKQLQGRDILNDLGINKFFLEKLKAAGITEINDSTRAETLKLFEESANTLYSADTKAELKTSFEGVQKVYFNSLFGPEGTFSISRDLDLKTDGEQSVFTELTRSANLIFGPDGFLSQTGRMLDDIFPDYDFMRDIRDGVKSFNDFLEMVNNLFKSFNDMVDDVYNSPIGKVLQAIDETLAKPGEVIVGVGPKGGVSEYGDRQIERGSNFFGGLIDGTKRFLGLGASSGYIPSAFDGLMPLHQAIKSEVANKPSGSGLVIANSSEYIFKDIQQLMNFVSLPKFAGTPGTNKSITIAQGAINIVANSNQDEATIADMVIDRLSTLVDFQLASEI